ESAAVQKSLNEIFEAERVVYVIDDIPDVDLEASRLLRVTSDFDDYQRECALQRDTLLIETDLVAISETCTMSELSLRAELEKMLARTIKQEPLTALPKHHRNTGHGSGSEEAKKQQPFVAPMRPNIAPLMMARQSRANDPFRSRPPNTSRPPSMHVDDFVAMESSCSSRSSMLLHRTSERPRPMERSRGPSRGMTWQPAGPSQRYF
ncbi:protein virilizer-like, partial [Tropilaelaps mercedesae]